MLVLISSSTKGTPPQFDDYNMFTEMHGLEAAAEHYSSDITTEMFPKPLIIVPISERKMFKDRPIVDCSACLTLKSVQLRSDVQAKDRTCDILCLNDQGGIYEGKLVMVDLPSKYQYAVVFTSYVMFVENKESAILLIKNIYFYAVLRYVNQPNFSHFSEGYTADIGAMPPFEELLTGQVIHRVDFAWCNYSLDILYGQKLPISNVKACRRS